MTNEGNISIPEFNFPENTIPEIQEFFTNVYVKELSDSKFIDTAFGHEAIALHYAAAQIAVKYKKDNQLKKFKELGIRVIASYGPLIIPLLVDELKLPITEQELSSINMKRLTEKEINNLEHLNEVIKPEKARAKLKDLDIPQAEWDNYFINEQHGTNIHSKPGSHEIKSLILIARGGAVRNMREVYTAVRASAGLPPKFKG